MRQFPSEVFFDTIRGPDRQWDLALLLPGSSTTPIRPPSSTTSSGPGRATPATSAIPACGSGWRPRLASRAKPGFAPTPGSTATSPERAAPAAAFASGINTHFLSARMGCQVLHPIYGLDLAALCVRDDVEDE